MRFLHAFSSLLIVGFLTTAKADSPQVVDLGYATYQGLFNSTTNITNFLGIRYAAPPTGNLRFQAPAPPQKASGIQIADTQPPACPSANPGTSTTTPFRGLSKRQSTDIEDCLFLNVHVSGPVNPKAKIPVIFFIHGGGYIQLSTLGMSGSDLIPEAGGGIVAVELEYRLGVFGFLPGKEVKQKGALNAGLLDQEFALKWVQQNIHLFGGDPTKVTIWGESAGAGAVIQHMVAHGGNTQPPLFHAAMTSSTFLPSQYNFDDPVPEKLYSELVQLAGCSNATDSFACLVEADAGALQAANLVINNSGFSGTFVTVPVVDGEFIVERPVQTIIRGKLNGNVFLAVTNTFEGRSFVSSTILANQTLSDYVAQLMPQFSEKQIQQTVKTYTDVGFNTVFDQAVAIMGESIFICPTYLLLSTFPGRSYKGEFAIPPGDHGNDIRYYFPSTYLIGPPAFDNAQFYASFAGSFLGVVRSFDPNIHPPVPDIITPHWATFNTGHTEMLFNETEDARVDIRPFKTDSALLQRCEFWKSVAASVPQ